METLKIHGVNITLQVPPHTAAVFDDSGNDAILIQLFLPFIELLDASFAHIFAAHQA